MKTWRAEAGKRAWWVDGNVDVLRVYKSGTATIQVWGRNMTEGKLVTYRGVSTADLSAPRRMIGGQHVEERPVMEECSECGGCGQQQAECVSCGGGLTNYNSDPGNDRCRKCVDQS